MSREFGLLHVSFWGHPDIVGLSDRGKLLCAYLITGPHSNGIGCYRLPLGYVSDDLGWPRETVSELFDELFRAGLVERDSETGFILLPKFLAWNRIANPNVGVKRAEEASAVPKTVSFFDTYLTVLERYGKHWPNGFIDGLRNGYPNQSRIGEGRRGEEREDVSPSLDDPRRRSSSQPARGSDAAAATGAAASTPRARDDAAKRKKAGMPVAHRPAPNPGSPEDVVSKEDAQTAMARLRAEAASRGFHVPAQGGAVPMSAEEREAARAAAAAGNGRGASVAATQVAAEFWNAKTGRTDAVVDERGEQTPLGVHLGKLLASRDIAAVRATIAWAAREVPRAELVPDLLAEVAFAELERKRRGVV